MSRNEIQEGGKCKKTYIMHNDYFDVFTGIGCFKGRFSCKLKMMQAKYIVCTLQETFRKELETTRTTAISTTRGR